MMHFTWSLWSHFNCPNNDIFFMLKYWGNSIIVLFLSSVSVSQSCFKCAAHTSPAPWNTMVWSHILLLVMRRAARSPATATAAVPEKKQTYFHLYFYIPMFIIYMSGYIS